MNIDHIKHLLNHDSLPNQSTENSLNDILVWLSEHRDKAEYSIERISWNECEKWSFDNSGYISHESGKFFSVVGIKLETNYGSKESWNQPIMNQPEIGILGIICKSINGVLHFLLQAKMEPGNPEVVQLSPTLQATRSNFTQIHKGKSPKYLDYFLKHDKGTRLIDQLQIEQSARFLGKRNRNMIVLLEESFKNDDPDFIWVSLAQLKKLLTMDNIVNMDTRTVISCLSSFCEGSLLLNRNEIDTKSDVRVLNYNDSSYPAYIYTDIELINWVSSLKFRYFMLKNLIPLRQLESWTLDAESLSHKQGKFFEVQAYRIHCTSREVSGWCQPLFSDTKHGLVAFIITKHEGEVFFLVNAKLEPGSLDTVDLSPTVSVSDYRNYQADNTPAFLMDCINSAPEFILYDTLQSEEGGRFYQVQNRYMLVYKEGGRDLEINDDFKLFSFSQVCSFLKHGYFNIEARSLIAAIDIFSENSPG